MNAHPESLAPAARKPFEGLLQILRFNYPMFLSALLTAAAGLAILQWLTPPRLTAALLSGACLLGVGWTFSALLVSHYVYDRSPLFRFAWLTPWLKSTRHWTNVHAGFDQTSLPLRQTFPNARATFLDLFNPALMTQRSIHRARSTCPRPPRTLAASFDHFPLADASTDAVLLIFAAHELRSPNQRAALFREAARALAPGGTVILIEHFRNLTNFLAFGPAVFHFFARNHWLLAGHQARLTLAHEFPCTPFVTCHIWRKPT